MILKLRLSGEEYQALLGALQNEANRYMQRSPGIPKTRPGHFAKIMGAKADAGGSSGPLPYHEVTLEVEENYTDDGNEFRAVPLSALTNIFDAIGSYPAAPPTPDERDRQHDDDPNS